MPELPEVEAQRQLLGQWAVGLEIATAVLFEQGGGPREGVFDDKVFGEEQTPATVSAALEGAHVLAARRKGKQLWLELGDAKGGPVVRSLLLHFGMTGAVVVKGAEAPLYKSFEIDTGAWPPRFTKLELILADRKGSMSVTLAFCDPRRFGRILIRQGATPLTSPPLSKLAADPISDPPTVGEFGRALSRSSAPVKAVLLDQTKVVCGVGNWIADEVFYQASVLPSTRCASLSQVHVSVYSTYTTIAILSPYASHTSHSHYYYIIIIIRPYPFCVHIPRTRPILIIIIIIRPYPFCLHMPHTRPILSAHLRTRS